jgi:agmatine/peptidylarginine deiminase
VTAPSAARRFPAEWEPQAGVMLTWPHAGTDWAEALAAVEPVFAAIGREVARREFLLNVCQSPAHAAEVRARLRGAGAPAERLGFAIAGADDTWARDHGPLTVLTGSGPRLLDFRFNGWGGKFAADRDDAITATLVGAGSFAATPLERQALVLEGGALETDGRGTLLATRHAVLTETRNPGLGRDAIETALRAALGIERFLWLAHGSLSGDDTDGHIDTLARFCDPGTIAYATADPDDTDHPGLAAMAGELAALRQADGRPYRLVPLPPPGRHVADGRRLPATYANFLVINGAVLLPVYGVPNDGAAAARLEACFPGREIVPIDCRAVIRQNGSLHCLTMQFPAGVPLGG